MRRVSVYCAFVAIFVAGSFVIGPSSAAQDTAPDYEGTIAALDSKIYRLQTSVAKRDRKIDDLRTRIADLSVAAASEVQSEIGTFQGAGITLTSKIEFIAGLYSMSMTVEPRDDFEPLTVLLISADGTEQYVFLLSIQTMSSWSGSTAFTVEESGAYFIQVDCNSPWTMEVVAL